MPPVEVAPDPHSPPAIGTRSKSSSMPTFWRSQSTRAVAPSGTTNDRMMGFGPVALYAGGTGEVEFKDVAFKDLSENRAEGRGLAHFRMQRISDFYYGWCAAVGRHQSRRHPGIIVAPPFYYLGPDYTERKRIPPLPNL